VKETRTPEEVDAAIQAPGTVMVVCDSVADAPPAGPGPELPCAEAPGCTDRTVDGFCPEQISIATDRARGYFKGYRPSSPSVGVFQNGDLVFMLERHQMKAAKLRDCEGIDDGFRSLLRALSTK